MYLFTIKKEIENAKYTDFGAGGGGRGDVGTNLLLSAGPSMFLFSAKLLP